MLASMADLRLPLESRPLQAWVSEPIKPVLDVVIMSNAVHAYLSQTDRGELLCGAGVDSYNGYAQRGSPATLEHAISAILEMFPTFSRVRMLRQWGRHGRHLPRRLPYHRPNAVERALLQLWLGHRWIQVDSGVRLGVRPHHCP